MKVKLLTAKTKDEIIRFDLDGRIYYFDPQINSYMPTERFVHLDYYGVALQMLAPEHLNVGWREPIENDVTYEIYDE